MKYCIDYTPNSSKLDKVNEINIPFNKDKILTLIDFLKNHTNQRVNIYIKDIEECLQYKIIEKMVKIKEEHPEFNFSLKFALYDSKLPIKILQKAKIDFFFEVYISQWETLLEILNLNVSDIYITGDLGFELDKVAEVAHKNNTKIRVFPNVSQKSWVKMPAIKTFFIRPEDIEAYEGFIDVLEIYGDRKKHDLYYEIYAEDKEWYGKLSEIILELNLDLDSKYTIPRFGERRLKCNRECFKGGKCQICERVEELSKTLEKANLVVKIDKEDKNG